MNKIFAIFRSSAYIGKKIRLKGWYRRFPVPYVEIYEMSVEGKTKKVVDPDTGEEKEVPVEPTYKQVTVGVKVGDTRFGGQTVNAKGTDTVSIEGKETQTIYLEVNGYTKGSQTVTFGKDTTVTFTPEP